MTIRATVIEDSISEQGKRLLTFLLFYPRFIHAELMTHRVFSRNASSSRAIPFWRLLKAIWADPAMPMHWGANQAGMQAHSQLTGLKLWFARKLWIGAMYAASVFAILLYYCGLHKQVVNRIMEPWAHITVVITATEWANWFALRAHKDAQPEIQELAFEMMRAMEFSTPKLLKPGEWHLPFVKQHNLSTDRNQAIAHITANGILRVVPSEAQILDVLKKVSVARCARTSFVTHEGKQTTVKEDYALHERLLGSQPLHASPSEHQARPDVMVDGAWTEPELHANFSGWCQYRKMLPGEYIAG